MRSNIPHMQQKTIAVFPYLNFSGNCREAMTFYGQCFDTQVEIMDFGSSPVPVPEEFKNNVMHAKLTKDGMHIMASDSMPGHTVNFGTNVHISVSPTSREEMDTIFGKLSEGGTVTMALQNTFWGAYFGMLTDKFGQHWMFNFESENKL